MTREDVMKMDDLLFWASVVGGALWFLSKKRDAAYVSHVQRVASGPAAPTPDAPGPGAMKGYARW